jgi:hypothetical protein
LANAVSSSAAVGTTSRWSNCHGGFSPSTRSAARSQSSARRDAPFPFTAASCQPPSFGIAATVKYYGFSLASGDWFYFAGIWPPATCEWPEAFAVLTIEANEDVAPFHDRQMAVLRREQRMAWLDGICAEDELLRPLPAGSFTVQLWDRPRQAELAL